MCIDIVLHKSVCVYMYLYIMYVLHYIRPYLLDFDYMFTIHYPAIVKKCLAIWGSDSTKTTLLYLTWMKSEHRDHFQLWQLIFTVPCTLYPKPYSPGIRSFEIHTLYEYLYDSFLESRINVALKSFSGHQTAWWDRHVVFKTSSDFSWKSENASQRPGQLPKSSSQIAMRASLWRAVGQPSSSPELI